MTRNLRFFLISLCLIAASNVAHANRQQQLDHLRQRISDLQQEMEKTSASKSEAADALRESERAISDSNRKLHDLSLQQQAAARELEQLKQKSATLDKDVAKQQAVLGKLLYRQYLGGHDDYLRLLLDDRDPAQVARNLAYYRYIARDRAAWLANLRSNLAKLSKLELQTQQKSEQIASLQQQAQAQRKSLESDRREHRNVLSKISGQLRHQRRQIGHLQRNENRLSQLVEKISRIISPAPGKTLLSNNRLPDDRFDGTPFRSLKGKLVLPVRGTVTNHFGMPHSDQRVLWKGLFVRAQTGSPVKAVAAGRVVFADWLRGFGNLLIIDHGKGYMSLYGNNETLYKQVGDTLHGGDTVAAVGSSGGNAESGLYFELRYEGKPLNPMKWIAAHKH